MGKWRLFIGGEGFGGVSLRERVLTCWWRVRVARVRLAFRSGDWVGGRRRGSWVGGGGAGVEGEVCGVGMLVVLVVVALAMWMPEDGERQMVDGTGAVVSPPATRGAVAAVSGGTRVVSADVESRTIRVAAGRDVPYTDSEGHVWRADTG